MIEIEIKYFRINVKLFTLLAGSFLTIAKAENHTCGLTSQFNSNFRIVNGIRANPYEVPWQVSLNYNGKHICGGSIISNKCILTAAHCLQKYRSFRHPINVVAGSLVRSRSSRLGTWHRVVRKIFHPRWNPIRTHSDIMVLCVNPDIHFRRNAHGDMSAIGPICLPPPNSIFAGKAKVSGFGKTSQFGRSSNRLYLINEHILKHSVCKRLYGRSIFPYDQRTMLCFGRLSGSGTCQGDSGGPLVVLRGHQWYQTGIVSYGSICGYSPTVFTRVAYFTDWIVRACHSCDMK